jgi:hypothetical protein
MQRSAKSTAVSVIVRVKKRSDTAGINAGAASTGKSLKPLSAIVKREAVNVIHHANRRPEIAGLRFLSAGAVTTMRFGT